MKLGVSAHAGWEVVNLGADILPRIDIELEPTSYLTTLGNSWYLHDHLNEHLDDEVTYLTYLHLLSPQDSINLRSFSASPCSS